MRLGITSKLFLAMLALSIIVAAAMGVAVRVSFKQGFLDYVNGLQAQRLEALSRVLAETYREHGGWDFLRDNRRLWRRLLRQHAEDAARGPAGPQSVPEPVRLSPRLSLLDAERRVVIGHHPPVADAVLRPILVDGRPVGWLAAAPFRRLTSAADLHFQEQQLRAAWIIAGLSLLLAAIMAVLLARVFLAPLKRITGATHRLAAGDYAARATVGARDELGQLAEDFNRLAHTLESNEQMRRRFMADISHELRTPLAVLRGELEALEDGVRALTPASLQSLQAEVAILSKLVDDLYQLSLADMGALNYRKVPVDIAHLLQVALEAYRERLAARRIALETALPDAGSLRVLGDPERLAQLFNNILENTVRYTDPGGRLRVSCRRDADRVHIDFQDSAPGVPAELLPRLFERLFRMEGSRNRASGGAGLGLAISQRIVEAHDGEIRARPSPLGGLWIAVAFPLLAQSTVPNPPEARPAWRAS
ncbi:sensor histidine kinase efflux regulator BaeS [Thermithiobacillus tepidarius DSM 3134]|uniref:sensor histidine kinase efflux regulator BaeS n=1 Tax=Thermithiobacillus tepidarius TaxID=929 RepID=UPI00042160D5|nr:sensor histidine kinase efflux regulator BaeS [Thermithiobacillus tepidarius]